MYTSAPVSTIQSINKLFKDFLWVIDRKTGRRKTSLVIGKKLTQPREKGGLGFMDYKMHANALLSKWVSKALTEPALKRSLLFMALSTDFT